MTFVNETAGGKLYAAMMRKCPSCGLNPPEYMKGPSGGMSTNIFCGKCGEGYNITPIIQSAEKIGKQVRYILPQYRGTNG
jgi:hypothetical protein